MTDYPFTKSTFDSFLAEGRLMGARSKASGKIYVPPRPLDPDTHGDEIEWVQLSGRGKLAAFTSIFIGPSAMIAAGYDRANPYMVGIVQLEEGPLISAQILGIDARHPTLAAIGTPLEVRFIARGAGEEKRRHLAFSA